MDNPILENKNFDINSAEWPTSEPPCESAITARWDTKKKDMVSISMLTYNHAKFLRQTFDGILCQETNFGFEILVHDDASTDGSQNIIKEYSSRYPNIIKPIYQNENKYSKGIYPSTTFNYPRCTSAYVAICEGDDCWTSPEKLQLQIDALEANPDIDLAFHQAIKIDYSDSSLTKTPLGDYSATDRIVPFIEIIHRRHGPLPTASCVIRQGAFQKFFSFIKNRRYLTVGDLYLQFFGSLRGGALYIAKPMSIYRIYTAHSWTRSILLDPEKKATHEVAMIRSYCELDRTTGGEYSNEIKKLIIQRIFWLFNEERTDNILIEKLDLHNLYKIYNTLLDFGFIEESPTQNVGQKKIVIYGAGSGCSLIMRKIKQKNIAAIIDIYGKKAGQTICNVPIESFENLKNYSTHPLIISTFNYDKSSFEFLTLEHGFDPSKIIFFYQNMIDSINIDDMLSITTQVLHRHHKKNYGKKTGQTTTRKS